MTKGHRWTSAEIRDFRRYISMNLTVAEIAKAFEVSERAIQQTRTRYKLPKMVKHPCKVERMLDAADFKAAKAALAREISEAKLAARDVAPYKPGLLQW